MKIIAVVGVVVVTAGAVASWWAGFLPLTTRPETVGIETHNEAGSLTQRFVPVTVAMRHGDNCEDKYAPSPRGAPPHPKEWDWEASTCWLQEIVPFYGLGAPRWLLQSPGGSHARAMFRTYTACVWRAADSADCVPMPEGAL